MKKILTTLSALALMCTMLVPSVMAVNVVCFTDVDPDHWAADAVYRAVMLGAVNGTSPTSFDPNGKVTHAQFAKMLACWTEAKPTGSEPFADVKQGDWYYESVSALQAILPNTGNKAGSKDLYFYPQAETTREYFIATLMKTTNYVPEKNLSGYFKDIETVDPAFAADMRHAIACGIIGGYNDATIRPKAPVTRAEAVVMINRMLDITRKDLVPGAYNGTMGVVGGDKDMRIDVTLTNRHNPVNIHFYMDGYSFDATGTEYNHKVAFSTLDSNYNFISGVMSFDPNSTSLTNATLTVQTFFKSKNTVFSCNGLKFEKKDFAREETPYTEPGLAGNGEYSEPGLAGGNPSEGE